MTNIDKTARNIDNLYPATERIIGHLTYGPLDRLVLEMMTKDFDVDHLYVKNSMSVIRVMPAAILFSVVALGMIFPYFSLVFAYIFMWSLVVGYRYKVVSGHLSTLSRMPVVREAIELEIQKLYSSKNTQQTSNPLSAPEEDLLKALAVQYLKNNEKISGKQFFNIYSLVCKKARKSTLIKMKSFSSILPPRKKKMPKDKVDELFQSLIAGEGHVAKQPLVQDEEQGTLEILTSEPKASDIYSKGISTVAEAISENASLLPDLTNNIAKNNLNESPANNAEKQQESINSRPLRIPTYATKSQKRAELGGNNGSSEKPKTVASKIDHEEYAEPKKDDNENKIDNEGVKAQIVATANTAALLGTSAVAIEANEPTDKPPMKELVDEVSQDEEIKSDKTNHNNTERSIAHEQIVPEKFDLSIMDELEDFELPETDGFSETPPDENEELDIDGLNPDDIDEEKILRAIQELEGKK